MKTFRQFREETIRIPVIPYKPNLLQRSVKRVKNFLNRYNHRIKNLVEIKGSNEERVKLVRETLNI